MSKRASIADKIMKRAVDIRESAENYFATHQVLDGGDKLRKDVREDGFYVNPSHINVHDLTTLAKHASSLLDKELMKYNVDAARNSAIELAVKTFANGKYDGKIGSVDFFKILNLMNTTKVGGKTMKRTAKYYTEKLDSIANEIRTLVKAGYLAPRDGYQLEMTLDKVSDSLESRLARTLEQDADEKYMKNFGDDPATLEQDSDEKYMKPFHNSGQNIMGDAMKGGEFKPEKKVPGHGEYNKAGSLNAAALAAKRQK